METNVRYTIAGLFVLVLFAVITLSVIWLSAGFSVETYDTYKVYMKESVSGLSVDGAVEFNGVNVGTVKSIKINQKDPELVELLLRIRSTTPISQGTNATMNLRGLTGVTFIALRDVGEDKGPIPILPGEQYPIIKTGTSLLTRLDVALTQLNKSFQDVSISIQKLLNNDNLQSIKLILANLTSVSEKLTPLLQNGFDTLDNFKRETLPAANQAITNLNSVMSNMAAITLEMKQNPAVLIRGTTPLPLGPGEK